jgi:hypothetical protein
MTATIDILKLHRNKELIMTSFDGRVRNVEIRRMMDQFLATAEAAVRGTVQPPR